jgi:hypothetical protein
MASAGTTALIAERSIRSLLKPSLRPLKPGQALRSSKRHAHRVKSSDLSAGTVLPSANGYIPAGLAVLLCFPPMRSARHYR